jgi:hypothetical protein
MKKLLFFAILASLTQASIAQSFLNKLNKKLDSLNSKKMAWKRKTDSAKATTQALTGTPNNATAANNNTGTTIIPASTTNTGSTIIPATVIPASTSGTTNTNSGDQLVFAITGCNGSIGAQTVTISFTIANPVKVNQTINIGLGPACKAIDADGDACRPKECMLANGNGAAYTELPTGLTMKGSITFSNVLSKEAQFSMVQFNIFTRNSDGGRDPKVKAIDMRNVPITWQ